MGPKHSKKPAKPKLPALPAGGSQRSTRLTSARQQQIADKVAGSTRSRNLFDDSEDEIEDTDIAMVDDEDKERRKSNPTWKADNSPTDGKSTLPDPDDDEQPEQQAEWEYGIFGLQWTDEHLHNDPVFKSADAEAAYAAALGATAVQPAQHVEDNLFPNAAGFWGLQRWLPEPGKVYIKLHSGSRGPSCYLTARGNKATCHFQYYAIPFLYDVTILDIRCPNAEAAGYPTLVHRWDPVDGYLGVCSFCYLNNQGGCETPKYQLTWVRRSPYSSAEYQVAKRGRNRHWGNPKLHEVIRVQLGLAHMPMSIDHSDGQSLQARTPAGGSEQSTDQTTAAQEDVEDPFKQPTSALDLKTPPFGARFPDNFSTTAWTGSLPTVQEETSPLAGKNQGSSSSLAADAEGKKRKAEQDAEQSIKSAKTDTAEGRAEDIVMADHSQTDDLQNKAGSVDNSKLTDEYRQLAQTQQRAQKGKEAAAALKNLLSGRTSASAEPQPAAATQPIEQRAASEPDRSRRAASVSSKQELFATASQPHSTQPRHPPVGFTTGLLSECIKTDVHALNSSCDELMNAADENVQQALDTLKASWQAVQGRIMASKNDSHALENQVIDNVNRSAVFETENARLKESVKEKEMFIRKLEAQITRTRNELDTALHPKTAAEAAAAAHAADKANFEELAKKAGVDRTRAEAQLQEQTAEITELRQKQEEVAKAAEEVLDSYTQETNAKEVLQTENNQLRTEKDVLQTEKDQLQQEKDALARERDESQTSAARLDSSVIELTQKNAELERTLLDLRMSIASPASQFPPSPDHAGPPGESRIPVTPATLATGLGRPPAFSPTAAQTTSAVSPASVLASPHDHTHAHQPQTQQSSPAAQSSLNEPYNPYAARTADAPLLSPGGGPQNTALTGEQAFIEHENVESAAGAADSAAPGL